MFHIVKLLVLFICFSCTGNTKKNKTVIQHSRQPFQDSFVVFPHKSVMVFQGIIALSSDDKNMLRSKPERMIYFADFFKNAAYKAHTLEAEPVEKLLVNLCSFDCTTFVESMLAMSISDSLTVAVYAGNLKKIRYRNGILNGYASRLHYFSDWLFDNEKKGVLKEITEDLGGVRLNKTFNFMSNHPNAYKQLSDTIVLKQIEDIEKMISARSFFYLPKSKIKEKEHLINNGDIIAITTTIEGLDVVHTGLAFHQNGRLHLLHASSTAGKVVVSEKPLAEMLAANSSQSGIKIARVVEN